MTKKYSLLTAALVLLTAITLFTSCKKDDENNGASIKGKWVFELEQTKTYQNGVLIYDVKDEGDGTSFMEITDTKLTMTDPDGEVMTFTYDYNDETKTLKLYGEYDITYKVKTLTANKLVIEGESETREGGQRDIYTITFSR